MTLKQLDARQRLNRRKALASMSSGQRKSSYRALRERKEMLEESRELDKMYGKVSGE